MQEIKSYQLEQFNKSFFYKLNVFSYTLCIFIKFNLSTVVTKLSNSLTFHVKFEIDT